MKICPKCKNEHEKQGTFCSRSCANSRIFSESAIQKKREAALRNAKDPEYNKRRLLGCVKQAARVRQENIENQSERDQDKYDRNIKREWDSIGYDMKRWLIIYEQNNKCNHCDLDEWREQPMSLEMDHIDGDRYNNDRKNLEAVCPNCHMLTETWRGKHRKGKIGLTDQQIYDAYIEAGTVRQTIDSLKLRRSRQTEKRILRAVEKIIPR